MRLQEGVIEQGGWWALCKDTALGVVFSILCTIRRLMSCGHLDGNTLKQKGTEKFYFTYYFKYLSSGCIFKIQIKKSWV